MRKHKIKLIDDVLSYLETRRRFHADAMLTIRETEVFFNQQLEGARMAFCEIFDADDEEQRALRDALYERYVRHFKNVSGPWGFEPVLVDEPDEEGGES
jgi:hypothetical protein